MGTMTATGVRAKADASRIAVVAAAGVATAVAVFGLWSWWGLTIDDAYITFRYSQNLADGHGPVWNPGIDPVQGYTNLLWMVLLAVPAWAGASLPVAAKIMGVAALAAAVWQVYEAAGAWSGRRFAGIGAAAVLLLMVPTYIHTVAGLETMLYAVLLLRFVWAVTAMRSPGELVVLGLLLGVCRPEGFAVAGLGLAYTVWRHRTAWWTLGAYATGVASLAGWQWWYYGWPLPNTFYVKTVTGNGAGGTFLDAAIPMVTVAVLALVVGRLELGRRDRVWVAVAMVVALAPYAVSELTMNYAMRFAYHVAPLSVAAAAAGLARIPSVRPAIALLALAAWPYVGHVRAADVDLRTYTVALERTHVALGAALAEVEHDGLTMGVHDAGAIPYYSGWHAVDLVGLNDELIAHGTTPAMRVAADPPDVLVVARRPDERPDRENELAGTIDTLYQEVGAVPFMRGVEQVILVSKAATPETVGDIAAAVTRAQSPPY